MKKHNRIIAGIMAVCLIGGVGVIQESIVPVASSTASAEEEYYTYENLTYDFLKDGTIEIKGCDKSVTEVIIPSEINGIPVTSIGKRAFYGDKLFNPSAFTSITIPDTVTNIGEDAFSYCKNLTSIEIPDNVTVINPSAFYCCNLTEIIVPESVTAIGEWAFWGCKSITILSHEFEIIHSTSAPKTAPKSPDYVYPIIYGYSDSTTPEYVKTYKNEYDFVALDENPPISDKIKGDINGDGEFNISDAVLLQKYLLGMSGTEISDWKQADLNCDGTLDVFDFCYIRKKLIEK